ncbi:MAG TPA: CoA-binding protein, partial [Streptosporangiaceae bacterium]
MTLAGLDNGSARARTSLDHMFRPKVIAVVGASRDPAKWGRRVLEYTGRGGFGGALYGVNPSVADLNVPGVRTVPALSDIDQPIDLAVLARPASATAELLEECAASGVRSVLITAAGFGELGGEHLASEQRMVARAREAGIRLLGPNTFGMFVADSRVNLTPREHIPRGSVAMLSQSGNVVVGMYEQARQAGIGFSACVGVGNQVDVGLGELLTYFASDPGSDAAAVYVEGLRGSGAEFRAGLAACRAAGKPVVVLKAGRSRHAASAVATHTGALASDERVWHAVLADAGAIQVGSTRDLVDTLAVACSVGRHGGRAMVITDGGGDSVMAIDWLTASGLSMATLSAKTRAALDDLIPAAAPRAEGRNPVTLDTAGGVEDDPMLLARCARLAAEDDGVDVIVAGGLFGGYPKVLDG